MTYREWIPVREQLPTVDGFYETLVKPLLDDEPAVKVQMFKKQRHAAISGWSVARVTHWRRVGEART